MCGIVGLHLSTLTAQKSSLSLFQGLHQSLKAIQHRGYDGAGVAYRNHEASTEIHCLKRQGMIDAVFQDIINRNTEDPEFAPEAEAEADAEAGTEAGAEIDAGIDAEGMGRGRGRERGRGICGEGGSRERGRGEGIGAKYRFEQGLAHTRYKTIGDCKSDNAQPLLTEDRSLCLAHNGQVEAPGYSPDSQCILELFQDRYFPTSPTLNTETDVIPNIIWDSIRYLYEELRGSYSCVMLIQDHGMLAFRDPLGIRPLVLGITEQNDILIASESISHKALSLNTDFPEWETLRDIDPGEAIFINCHTGKLVSEHLLPISSLVQRLRPCLFEYIYLANAESVSDGLSVAEARRSMGQLLAERIAHEYPQVCSEIDVVIPIPETSCLAAQALAEHLKLKYIPHFLRLNPNRSQPRSFILPTQSERVRAVSDKFLLPAPTDFHLGGCNILLVDDSIVRGTTLSYLIKTVRERYLDPGPSHIYVASIAPPVRRKNQYGIDIPNSDLLVARGRSEREIAQLLGADGIIYQSLESLTCHLASISPRAQQFEQSMFEHEPV